MPTTVTTPDTGEKQRSTGTYDSIISQIMASDPSKDPDIIARRKKQEAAIDETMSGVESLKTSLDDLGKNYDAQIEKLNADKPPQANVRSGMEAMGQSAAIFGALAGLLTRRPLIAGMKAATAAIGAARESDWENYKIQYQNWQTNHEHAMEIAKLQNDKLKSIIESEKLSVDQKLNYARALGELTGDQVLLQNAHINNLKTLFELKDAREKTQHQYALDAGAIAQANLTAQAMQQLQQTDEWKAANPLQKLQMLQGMTKPLTSLTQLEAKAVNDRVAAGEPLEQAIQAVKAGGPQDSLVDAIGQYRSAPLSAWAMARPEGRSVMDAVFKKYPDYDSRRYFASNREMAQFYGGQLGNAVRFVNVAIQHLDVVEHLADALQNNDVQLLNRARNEWRTQFGSDLPTNLETVAQIVGQEVVKAVVTGGGTGRERDETQNNWNVIKSADQLKGATIGTRALLAGQLSGLRNQYETGLGLKDFDQWLLPETQRQLGQPNFSFPGGTTIPGPTATQPPSGGGWSAEEIK